MANRDDDIHSELQNISFLLGDLNAIRNGEYEGPKGADPENQRVRANVEDVYNRLGNVIGHLERMNVMMYVMGEHMVGADWQRKIGEG